MHAVEDFVTYISEKNCCVVKIKINVISSLLAKYPHIMYITLKVQYPCHIQQYPRANVLIFAEYRTASIPWEYFIDLPRTWSVCYLVMFNVTRKVSVFEGGHA